MTNESSRHLITGIQSSVSVRNRKLFAERKRLCRSPAAGGTDLLADPSAGPDGLRGFALSGIFSFRYGDSPYQAFSAFAGNPYFIDLDALVREGLLEKNEVEEADFGQSDPSHVDYLKLYRNRFTLLGKACGRSHFEQEEAYQRFAGENACWLDDYVLFMGIKNSLGGISWTEWPDALRMRDPQAMEEMKKSTAQEGRLFRFLQYKFMQQWQELKEYAHSRGVKIIGDIPIYVSPDSSDAWADYELFQFDEDHRAAAVAGCPPDAAL